MTVIAERLSCASVDEVSALLPVVGGTTTVPLVDGTQRVYANLDYAASAPALEAVAARVTEVLPLYASVHRGAGYLSQVSTALYESARQTIARFVEARPDDVAIITRNTTDSLNLLAGVVPDGGRVLVLDDPTRGIDVATREELYATIRALAAGGAAVLLRSESLEELIGLSNRIVVVRRGAATTVVDCPVDAKPDELAIVRHMI